VTGFAQRNRDMSASRLAQLAAYEDSLVPAACEALRAEIARRPPPVEERASAKDPLDGVGGGWLAWYCLGLFGGSYWQIRLATSVGAGSAGMLALAIFALGIAAWNLATGISILRRARSALWMIFLQLTMRAVQATIFVVAGVAFLASSHASVEEGVVLIAVGLLIGAGCAIWFRYFEVSKSVKVTFGRNM
jgi:hypothetical protein